ncbi:MAG: hypothetical protein QXG01_03585, partial [Candidatus Bathyarchaeia archaeon]
VKEDVGLTVIRNAYIGAAMQGFYPKFEFIKLDLRDEEKTSEVLAETKPTVILNATSMLSSFFYVPLIKKRIGKLGLRSHLAGHTLAKDIALIYRLMKAIKKSGIKTHVANIAFPDNSHAVLAKVGLAPDVGGGTLDLNVYYISELVADRFKIPAHNVWITMVAHHALRVYPAGEIPYYMNIRIGDRDVTKEFNLNELIEESNKGTLYGLAKPYVNASMVAASLVKNALAILNNTGLLTHAPGVEGLPGGVPTRLSSKGAELVVPQGLTREKIIEMNYEGMKADGIEKIDDDGTVTFTEQAIRLLKEILGIDRKRMRLDEAEKMAEELIESYSRLAKEEMKG